MALALLQALKIMHPAKQSTSVVFRRLGSFSLLVSLFWTCARAPACVRDGLGSVDSLAQSTTDTQAESDLVTGIALTHKGDFTSAIPHLLAARGRVADEYAANFDLALCYVATNQYEDAVGILASLRNGGHATADVNNLLAQTYIGVAQPQKALATFQQAVQQTPLDEKLYLLMADACMDHESYDLGTEILNIGLQHLPRSARLHYERGVFLTFQNQPDLAKSDYKMAAKLAPEADISYMALGQNDLLEGNLPGAIEITRKGIRAGHENYILLTIFGDAVVRSGATSDERVFADAQQALEESVTERPNYAASQLALGELYLAAGRLDDAVAHLENARQLAPLDPAVYSHLAIAYRRQGRTGQVQQVLTILSKLNRQQTEKYKTDSPTKLGYIASGRTIQPPSQ
ncbi:MAG: tetratricopeptide repeat protein [Candidatus Acidiferrales bacterium]